VWDLCCFGILRSLEWCCTDVSGQPVGHIFKGQSSYIAWPLKMGPIRCFETSVRNYHSTLRKIPKERKSHLHRRWSLKSRIVYACVVSFSRLLRARYMLCPNHPLWCVYPNLMKCTNCDTSGYTHKLVEIHDSNLYHIARIARPASSSLFNIALILM